MQLNVCISAALDVHAEFLLKLEKIFSYADGHIEKIFIQKWIWFYHGAKLIISFGAWINL